VVSFTPLPLYSRYPLDKRLGGPQSRSGRFGEEKILAPYRDSNSDPSLVQPIVSRYTDCATPAPYVYKVMVNISRNGGFYGCKDYSRVCTINDVRFLYFLFVNRDVSVGIAIGYELDDCGV
jgi:hypothetical protein